MIGYFLTKLPLDRLLNSIEFRILADAPQAVKDSLSQFRKELHGAELCNRTRPRFSNLGSGLKLHLGCGADIRPGWINVDLNLNKDGEPTNPDYFNFDLRQGIPLPSGSVKLIYSSHFFEHLTNHYGSQLFKESFRVLEPNGTFRVALPNQENMCRVYLARDRSHWSMKGIDVEGMCPGVPLNEITYGDFFDTAIYQFGEHVTFYDVERTVRILKSVGFEDVAESPYIKGLDQEDELRRFGSFYVQGRKPE